MDRLMCPRVGPACTGGAIPVPASAGSGALKMWQAVIVAAIFEFTGALFLGAVVVGTARD